MTSALDDNKQLDVGEIRLEAVKRPSRVTLEGSLSALDDIFRKVNDSDNKDVSKDLISVSSGSVSRRLSDSLRGRVSKFNANPTDGNFLSPMQSLKKSSPNFSSQIPKLNFSPTARRLNPNKALETRIKSFENNASDTDSTKVNLRSPQEIKKLVKSSRDNQRLDPILNWYEHFSEEKLQQRKELASKIAARERRRRLGCSKSEEERALLLKQNRSRFYRSSSEKILDAGVSEKLNYADNGVISEEVWAVQYDFTDFVPPSFQKTEIQRELVLGVIQKSFVFAEFRNHGKARCDGVVDMLVDAFEPVSFPSGHILLDPDLKKENDEFYIVERGRIDFKMYGRSVAEIAKVGGYFGELALLHNNDCERSVSVHGTPSREARLLKINQKTFRGILTTSSKLAAKEKRDSLLGVEFLSDLINGNEEMIRRLTSIMIREEMKLNDVISSSQDNTFVVIQSGRVHVVSSNEFFEPGDYFGSRALMRTVPRERSNETNLVACSENVVLFRIDSYAMGQIVGPNRIQNLVDMRRFATTQLIEKANLTNDAYEIMAETIEEKKLSIDDENTWKVDKNDPAAVYVVREGSLVVSSHDKSTGSRIDKVVTEGNVFGLEQLKLSTKNGKSEYRRRRGLNATISSGVSTSIGVLPLDEVKFEEKDGVISPEIPRQKSIPSSTDIINGYIETKATIKIECRDLELSTLQQRANVREIVQSKISYEDLEKIRLLGEGEFGEVWLVATNVFHEGYKSTRQKFALKSQFILDDGRGMDATDVIFREIEMMKELRHSQLVDLVNTYQDETHIHMLMRLVPYGELWDRMHREDSEGNWTSGLPDDHAKFYAMSIADTLTFIHSRGIIYRDLKPENVLIDVDGYPVIVDFGFAKFCSDKTYTFVGTPNYVAPEIITNAGHNKCVDFWAFGVTVYEMVTGENPFFFDGMDSVSLYHSICHEKYFSLSDKSEEFVDFVDRLLKKDPVQRLGMLHGGANEILQHSWFDGLELARIRAKSFRAPWKPTDLICDGFENLSLGEEKDEQTKGSSFSTNDSASFCKIVPNEARGEVQEPISPSSRTTEVEEISTSKDVQEPIISPSSSKAKKKKKKKSRKEDLNEPKSNKSKSFKRGSISNSYDNSSEFQFVTPEQSGPKVRNPKIRRSLSQRRQSQNRRSLLQDSFRNFGIDWDNLGDDKKPETTGIRK